MSVMLSKEDYYKKMRLIRSFEEMILDLFSKNEISGTTHTCIGQEAIAIAAMENLQEGDIVFSNHRCHGHYLAYGGPVKGLLAELMTRKGGVCGGRGGTQHLHYKNFYTNGIQGGIVPNATGMAWAEKIKGTDNIGIVFIGDGTLGQGIVYETMNMASLFEVPILYVIENNQYAMTTHVKDGVSGEIQSRPRAFGINTYYTNSNVIEEICKQFQIAKEFVRREKKPACIVVDTYRLSAHSKGDDTRASEEIEQYRQKDALTVLRSRLQGADVKSIDDEVDAILQKVLAEVKELPIAELPLSTKQSKIERALDTVINRKEEKCVEQINSILKHSMKNNNSILLIGEDVRDPYGGAFKVTKGLSAEYEERVINTPISEAGFTGIAVGLAMNGMIPIVEMMFGDFVSLAFDQILNHATKYQWIYGDEVKVPIILRTPMGGGRGYGAVHSQSLEKHYMGIPGLEIMSLSPVHDNYQLYKQAIDTISSPLQIIENKRMYSEPMLRMIENRIEEFFGKVIWNEKYPTVYMSLDKNSKPDVVVLVYSNITREVIKAALEAMVEDEIQVDIAVVSQVYPLPMNDFREIVFDGIKIVTVEEGTLDAGWGSEVIANVASEFKGIRCGRVAAENVTIANGKLLEEKQIVNSKKIVEKIREVYYED